MTASNPAPAALSFGVKSGWAIGELAVATYIGLSMTFMLFYATQVLAIPPALAGIALLVPRLVDAISDPLMGALSDRTHSRRGRRRVYLLIGAPLLALTFAAVFFVPVDASLPVRVGLLVLAFLASNLAVTVYEVPYAAMAAEMSSDYRQRIELTGYKMMAARAGIILALFVSPIVIGWGASPAQGFRMLGVIAAIFMLVTGWIGYFATARAPRSAGEVRAFALRQEFDAIRTNVPFRNLWFVFLAQNLAIGASATALIYFLTYHMQVVGQTAGLLLATGAIAAAFATPLWIWLARRRGKSRTYHLGIALSAAIILALGLVQPGMAVLLFILLAINGVVDGGTQLLPNSMVPDTVEADEAITGERREGALFGAWGFCRKLGMTLGAFAVSLALAAVGFAEGASPAAQTPAALTGIRLIYVGVPLISWLMAMALLSRYDLDEARFAELKQIIARRNAERDASRP